MGATETPVFLAAPAAIHNILFATDFSSCSDAALPFAVALAKRFGAALFITHVLPPEPRLELPLDPPPDAINPTKQEAQHRFDALLESGVLSGVVHEPILRSGDFWETMQTVIADRSIDLVVAGTHGRQGIRKLILGSVAEQIFRRAACPVITIGPDAAHALVTDGLHSVVFATDFSAASLNALPFAYGLAEREGAQLTLMHVIEPAPPAIDAVVLPRIDLEVADEARKHLAAMIATCPPLPLQPEVLVMDGEAAETIVYAATERHASMIIMGVRHKSTVATHSPWSVADAVVCRARCPVLTVRGD